MPKRVLIPFRHATKVKPYEAAARSGGAEPQAGYVGDALSLAGAFSVAAL